MLRIVGRNKPVHGRFQKKDSQLGWANAAWLTTGIMRATTQFFNTTVCDIKLKISLLQGI
ncbi:MAG: hypothetical protein DM484_00930 [Candidatus Methylumidiphilus alinenensis]|uniref:Uncharacterized protein n=1 Tax=Candidatus Methylumidiphilus alinenensis TaxID=2202197 RepID=A0A2W4TWC5_9GAMM|nr:MAG: hypothetical protein DM484_00930 [Candidatus Methylumidiphilus alinenensis]